MTKISTSMVMHELRELSERVSTARQALSEAIDARNELLYELKALGVSERRLMSLTGLSRETVAKVTQGARTNPPSPDWD